MSARRFGECGRKALANPPPHRSSHKALRTAPRIWFGKGASHELAFLGSNEYILSVQLAAAYDYSITTDWCGRTASSSTKADERRFAVTDRPRLRSRLVVKKMEMSAARLKHFGWGREGEGLTAEEEAFVMERAEARFGTALTESARAAPRRYQARTASRHCAQFADATLGFLREKVPRDWAHLCDSVTDNFRVINPKDFRVMT